MSAQRLSSSSGYNGYSDALKIADIYYRVRQEHLFDMRQVLAAGRDRIDKMNEVVNGA